MRLRSAMLALVLFAGVSGCGEMARTDSSSASSKSSHGPRWRVTDAADGDTLTFLDSTDDEEVVAFGSEADPRDRRAVEAFTRRYIKAGNEADGAILCSLLAPNIARKLPQAYGGRSNPSFLQGKTCTEVMSKLFKHRHRQLSSEASGYRVTAVRIKGSRAFALMAFSKFPERRFLSLARRAGGWRLSDELIDGKYP
jgi:hypothetical protein